MLLPTLQLLTYNNALLEFHSFSYIKYFYKVDWILLFTITIMKNKKLVRF